MATESYKTKPRAKRIVVVPRGLSQHGLPKTPGFMPGEGSVRSYRFASSSPPLSPRSFLSLFRSEDSPLPPSRLSTTSTQKDPSPFPSPSYASVFGAALAGAPPTEPSPVMPSCPSCAGCQHQRTMLEELDYNKENEHPNESSASSNASLTKLANRLKSALGTKRKENQYYKPPKVHKVEATHWTEM